MFWFSLLTFFGYLDTYRAHAQIIYYYIVTSILTNQMTDFFSDSRNFLKILFKSSTSITKSNRQFYAKFVISTNKLRKNIKTGPQTSGQFLYTLSLYYIVGTSIFRILRL